MLPHLQGLNERHSLPVEVLVVHPLLGAVELLLHQSLLVLQPLLELAVTDLHLGDGVVAIPILLLLPILMFIMRSHLPSLVILRYHLGIEVEAPLPRTLGPGGRCEGGGPAHLPVTCR